ncbi:MAG TPA: M12 family metallo-peptidase, partial [Steroidobacteraceae bacterium]|nr:M12 family metallo-peptidase [Steroidobacteraceae bacterium]
TVLADNGPLTSTVPDMLLEQFEFYRRATPDLASRGLSHLVTGRDLYDSTVGIAYLNTLCSPQYAASLSQTIDSTYYSSLVFAHEIGHNFGAPHDGRNDSPCLSAGTSYLMAASVSGNSNFSQCSLEQMAPTIAAATCLRATPHADVAVELPAGPIKANAGEEVHTQVDVLASGSFASEQVTLNLTGSVELMSGSVTNGTCTVAAYNKLACALGDLPPGARRTVDVTWRSNFTATTTLTATVASSNDGVVGNNQDTVELQVVDATPQGNVSLSFVGPTTVTAGTDFDLPRFTVSSSGTSTGVHVELVVPAAFTIKGFSSGGAGCTINAGTVTCDFGTLSPSDYYRNIALRLHANQTGTFTVTGQATATNDSTPVDNSASVSMTVVAGSSNSGGSSGGSSGGGGGGGGGGIDPSALLLLLMAPAFARRHRRR